MVRLWTLKVEVYKKKATRNRCSGQAVHVDSGGLPGGVEAVPPRSVQNLSPALGAHDAILKVIAAAKVSRRIPVQGHGAGGGGVHDKAHGCRRRS